MIVIECAQNSLEWYQARAGYPTASKFSQIYGPGLKKDDSAEKYANQLIAEIMIKGPLDTRPPNFYEQRGHMTENEASEAYAYENKYQLARAGFIIDDEKRWGCSLDRLVIDNNNKYMGAVEIKCLNGGLHMHNFFHKTVDRDHTAQIQGQLLVTGLPWVDYYQYYPGLPPIQTRAFPEPMYQIGLKDALDRFRDLLNSKIEKLIELGYMEETNG